MDIKFKFLYIRIGLLLTVVCNNVFAQITNPHKNNQFLYGFNIQTFFENKKALEYPALLEMYSDLDPEVVRFPGGGPSNYYRFDSINETLINTNKNWKIDLQKVVAFFKKNKTKVNLVINILDGTREEGIALTRYFQSRSIEVCGVELGNELYFKKYKVPVSKYISVCSEYAKVHKKLFPDIPVVALAAQIGVVKMGGTKDLLPYKDFTNWNLELSKANFYDAISFHLYVGQDACLQKINQQEKFSCALKDLDVYCEQTLPKMLSHYQNLFTGKPVWITEWNYFEPEVFGNTFLHALFIQRFMFTLKDSDANIGVVNYHNITTHSPKVKGYNLISIKEKNVDPREYISHYSFSAFTMIKEIFKENMPPVKVDVQFEKSEPLYYQNAFLGKDTLVIILANTSGKERHLQSINYKNTAVDSNKKILQHTLNAESLDSVISGSGGKNDLHYTAVLKSIILNPFSITKISIPL